MPILCIEGEDDVLIAPEMIRQLAKALPNARLAMVPGAGIRCISRSLRSSTRLSSISSAGLDMEPRKSSTNHRGTETQWRMRSKRRCFFEFFTVPLCPCGFFFRKPQLPQSGQRTYN